MSPRFVLGRENVPCVAEVVNRLLKADCTDFMQNVSQRCKIKVTECHFNILWCFGVIEENLRGRNPPPPGTSRVHPTSPGEGDSTP